MIIIVSPHCPAVHTTTCPVAPSPWWCHPCWMTCDSLSWPSTGTEPVPEVCPSAVPGHSTWLRLTTGTKKNYNTKKNKKIIIKMWRRTLTEWCCDGSPLGRALTRGWTPAPPWRTTDATTSATCERSGPPRRHCTNTWLLALASKLLRRESSNALLTGFSSWSTVVNRTAKLLYLVKWVWRISTLK